MTARNRPGPIARARWGLVLGLAPVLVLGLADARNTGSTDMATSAGVAMVLAIWAGPRPRVLIAAAVAIIVLSAIATPIERVVRAGTWESTDGVGVLAALTDVRSIGASSDARSGSPTFAYLRAEGAGTTNLTFEASLRSGDVGWGWYVFHPDFRLERSTDATGPYLSVEPPHPSATQRYLTRHFEAGAPLGGRTFRLIAEVRAAPFVGTGCQGLRLQVLDATASTGACQSVVLDPIWTRFELPWTVPTDEAGGRLRASLHEIDVAYDVRGVVLEELVDGAWLPVAGMEPVGLTVFALDAVTGAPRSQRLSVPDIGHAPSEHQLEVHAPSGSGPITIVAQVEPGVVVQLSDADFALAGWRMRAPERVQLWYGHPNLAGHALVALAGAVVATAPLGVAWASAVAAGPTIIVTGSRAALLAIAILAAVLVVRSIRSWPIRRRWGLALVLGVLAVLAVATVEPNVATLQALNRTTQNAIPRTEIWGFAIEAARARPWTGLAPATFAEAWRDAHPGDARRAPEHAHNLWIDLAVRYGFVGLLVALWWTGSLVVVAARYARSALVAIVPILVLQLFDTTLPIGWVLLPAVVAIGIAVRTGERPGRPNSSRR